MSGPPGVEPPDYNVVADLLKALAYPARLELLAALRTPRTLSEIRVTPHKSSEGERPGRPAARQTVQVHLQKLVESDLVRVESIERSGREVPLYAANPSKLYALLEELRGVVVQYAGRGLSPEQTSTMSGVPDAATVRGPRLVLVHGVYEGRVFPLTDATAQHGGWTIGRAKGLPIGLDYDPFVSHESARITRGPDGYVIADLGSKNGTWMNWVRLEPATARPIEAGDVVGVGRSFLCFATR